MAHVGQLIACGMHEVGSKGDRKAARCVREQMKKAGLSVTTESFSFHSYARKTAVLEAGTEKAGMVKLGMNSDSAISPVSSELAFVTATDSPSIRKADMDGKLVVRAGNGGFDLMSFLNTPKAVLSLSAPDFERLKATGASSGEIEFRGKLGTAKSSNIVGVLADKPGARKIVASAHYDSAKGPGANDNASGVAVLLEAARYFHSVKQPPNAPMRFGAFGCAHSDHHRLSGEFNSAAGKYFSASEVVTLRSPSMPSEAYPRLRCANYTRKSSEEGLERPFNSLDPQREACRAFINSQKHEGWRALDTFFDDGGFSSANMDRPGRGRVIEYVRERTLEGWAHGGT
jgi:hypothetical protein